MANRNIDESIRKPRQAKGTPFHKQRNIYAVVILGVSGLTALIYQFWPETQKIKKDVQEDKFQYSETLKSQIIERKWGNVDPNMRQVLEQLREKREANENIPQPQSWISKLFTSSPEL